MRVGVGLCGLPVGSGDTGKAQAGEAQAELFLVDNLAHVDLGPGGLDDQLTLWRVVYRLLEERDGAPAPVLPEALAAAD